MAEENSSSAEKSEEPTQKRLDKAREDGQTLRSRELNTSVILITGTGGMLLFGERIATQFKNLLAHNFAVERAALFDESAMLANLSLSLFETLAAVIPLFLLLTAAALLGPLLLGGWNISSKAIAPKASRMNPASGLGRMYGPKALIELAKAIAKVGLVGSVAFAVIYLGMPEIVSLQAQDSVIAMGNAVQIIAVGVFIICLSTVVISLIDIPIQIQQHTQKLRMTLQQVKDEMKDTDGKPEVKQKIRQLQQQMASNRMMADVGEADVVITNPDHYAVALRYDQGQGGAPILLAKGLDYVAFRIKDLAQENEIPVVESPELARAVYFNTDIGEEIPPGLYVAVAQVLAYLHQLRLYARGKAVRPKLASTLPIPEELKHA